MCVDLLVRPRAIIGLASEGERRDRERKHEKSERRERRERSERSERSERVRGDREQPSGRVLFGHWVCE